MAPTEVLEGGQARPGPQGAWPPHFLSPWSDVHSGVGAHMLDLNFSFVCSVFFAVVAYLSYHYFS